MNDVNYVTIWMEYAMMTVYSERMNFSIRLNFLTPITSKMREKVVFTYTCSLKGLLIEGINK